MKLSIWIEEATDWIEGNCFTSTDSGGDPICGGCGESSYGKAEHAEECMWKDLVRQGRAFAAQAEKAERLRESRREALGAETEDNA